MSQVWPKVWWFSYQNLHLWQLSCLDLKHDECRRARISRGYKVGELQPHYLMWGFIPDILNHTLFFLFPSPVPPPPDLNMSLNCSSCNPLLYAYPYHEGYMVLDYCQDTPDSLQTTSHNSWTWIKSHNGDKDLPKALCCWRTTIEDWDYQQLRKTLF